MVGPVRRAPIALLVLSTLVAACDSTALSQGDPTTFELSFDPQFATAADEVLVTATYDGVDDPDDSTGAPSTWAVVAWDGGDALEVREWEFRTNFRVRLRLGIFANATDGGHPLILEVRNQYGTFVGRGEFFVFR